MMTLQALYAQRAEMAYAIEQDTRTNQRPVAEDVLLWYRRLCEDIQRQERHWTPDDGLQADGPSSLSPQWCTLCGSATEEKIPEHLMCIRCEGTVEGAQRAAKAVPAMHGIIAPWVEAMTYLDPETDE